MDWVTRLRRTTAQIFGIGPFAEIDASALTAPHAHALQDKAGTLAHLEDIPAVLDYMDPTTTTTEELIDALIAGGWMEGPAPAVPTNTVLPEITGGTSVGSVLTLSNGSWTGSPTSYTKQWQEEIATVWTDIAGETGDTYTTDHNGNFRGEVIATNGVGDSAPAYSAAHEITSGTLMVFGNNEPLEGESGFPGDIDRSIYSIFTKENAGPVQGLFAYFRSDSSAGGSAKMLIYSVDGGQPDALIFESDAEAVPAGGGLIEFGITNDISGVSPSGQYALIIVSSSFTVQFGKRDDIGTTYRKEGIDFDSPPATFPTPPDANYVGDVSAWGEYLG